VVGPNVGGIATNASSLTITGYGFDATSDTVSLNGGVGIAATNIVMGTSGNPDSLQVALPDNLPPGSLTAVITAAGISSGSAVQVATVDPVVTPTAGNSLSANAATVTITGAGFDTVNSHNTVSFDNGAHGTVTAVNPAGTSLTVTFTVDPGVAGALDASVTSDGASSGGRIQVATVAPVVLANANQMVAANAPTITINGFGFDTASADTVTLNGISATISSATANQLVVDLPSGATTATGVTAGALNAVVTVDSISSGAVQVDTIIPVVGQITTGQGANVNTLTITGYGFDPNGTNVVALNDGATVNTVTATSTQTLDVTLTKTPALAGNLTGTVTTDRQSSGTAVQVATITPAITSSQASMAPNQTTLDIHGYGFDTVYYDNSVSFDDGAVGAVSAVNASGTDLTVTFSVEPPAVGTMDAVVTTDTSYSSGLVQVATVTPTVTGSSALLAANAGTLTINGLGFIPTPNYAENLVSFDNGAASGTVTAASATSLTVSLPGNLPAGSLTAVVTTNGASSSSAQVATITPFVSLSQTSVASNATTLSITGYGFDATPGNNMVSLDGAAAIAASSVSVGTGGAASSLKVTLPGNLPVGSLTAVVTTDTSYSSGPAVQVATITPAVTVNQASVVSNATTLSITGYGFDAAPGNNMVSLDGAAAIAASSVSVGTGGAASSLTVALPGNLLAGSLTAVVTTDTTYGSGPAVQVATVAPYVTSNTTNPLPANTATVTITGYGFDSTAGNNTVALDGGTPIAASRFTAGAGGAPSSLQVALPSTLTAGNLMAVVTTHGVSSSSTQVATLTPVVTSSSATVALNATSVVINGYGFDPAKANDSIQFNGVATGTVSTATANSLTVGFTKDPTSTGSLTAIVTTGTQNSGNAVSVGNVVSAVTVPTVTNGANTSLLANATSLTITGSGFDSTTTNNRLVFTDGAAGTVTGVNPGKTALTVQLTTLPTTAGALDASVISDGVSSGAAVQVATVKPVVSSSTATLAVNATTLTINGLGFDSVKANDSVMLYSGGSATGVAATITGTPTAMSITVTPPAGMALGNLTAVVTADSESSSSVQVATVRPVLTSSPAGVAVGATSMTINGFGFSTTGTSNKLTFNNGVIGTVNSSTANSLTVTFGTPPTTLGPLTVNVSTGGIADTSATPVTVGTVVPAVNQNLTNPLALGASQVTISGAGFDTASNGANNSVHFNLAVTGTVTAATANSLTVTLNNKPAVAGNLTATVTTDSNYVSSSTQVATIAPTVNANTSNPLLANTPSITISGSGFDPNGTNTVSLNGGTAITATNVTGTSLQVALPSTLTAGNLTAVVTTNGAASTSKQVATLMPVVNINTSNPLAANAGTLTIGGSGFDTVKGNDTVTLYSGGSLAGITATIIGTPTSTSISVTPPAGMAVGSLTAVVTVGTQNSGSKTQVATVVPAVTQNLTNPLLLGASSLTITGAGFDTTNGGANNTVAFNLAGVSGTVTAVNQVGTSLTVSFATNGKPAIAGNLTAIVTTDTTYSSGTVGVQVATIAPTVTLNAGNPLPANTPSITISGTGFDPNGTNKVSLNGGTPITATNVTGTSLQVALPTTLTAGNLMVVVTTNGVASTSTQVATLTPVVTGSQANLAAGAASLVINGFGFDTTGTHNTLTFNNGVTGTVSSATANTLNVTFGTKPTTAGSLTVTVSTDSQSSGISPVQVATVIPVVTPSTANLAFNSSTLTINGAGFSTTKSSDVVTLDGQLATVNTASATSLQVTLPAGLTVGNLMTVVTIGATSSTSTQVATLIPVVTGGTPSSLALGASSITINGFGFDTTSNGSKNTVQFNLGVTGQVSAATANTLTVTLNSKPATTGSLTATVTTDTSYSSGTVQVATIAPTVNSNAGNKLAANTATVTITGSGFASPATTNSVKLNGVTATVNSGSATQLVVAIPAGLAAGPLNAVVTSNSVASSSTQVATLTPVVTTKSTSVAHTVTTLTIYGYGFDTTTASNNTVVFTFSTGATVTGHVTAATAATSSAPGTLSVTYDTKPTTAGTLSAVVTTDVSYNSGTSPVVVATLT
jgi:hypothetical protein